jgi:CheY-like chemotaxis protein
MQAIQILIVEDYPTMRAGLSEVMKREGYTVNAVQTGEGVLRKAGDTKTIS